MNQRMSLEDAKKNIVKKLGSKGWAIKDNVPSSPAVRNAARKNTFEFVTVLKDKDLDGKRRKSIERALPYQQWLCNYYRYKIGIADEELGIPAFTVYTHGDSFEKCFEKLDNLL